MNHLMYFWYGLKKIYNFHNPTMEDMGAREKREEMLGGINEMKKTPCDKNKNLYIIISKTENHVPKKTEQQNASHS